MTPPSSGSGSGSGTERPPEDGAGTAAQLARREAELLALRTELEEFFRVASHDLRAPLRHIAAFGGLLRERIDELGGDAEAREYLGAMQRSGEQLTRMVEGLLDLSRIARAQLQMEPIDIAALAREVQAELSAQSAAAALIRWELPGAALVCEADAKLARQLLRYLLDNAAKFSSRTASPCIRLSAHRPPGGRLQLELVDNGAGFRMEGAARLFGVFERLHPASEFDGTGIGLAASRRIVERHGGQIAAIGEPGKGCTVRFDLP